MDEHIFEQKLKSILLELNTRESYYNVKSIIEKLPIDTEARLKLTEELIFQRATFNKNTVNPAPGLCGRLCQDLASVKVCSSDKKRVICFGSFITAKLEDAVQKGFRNRSESSVVCQLIGELYNRNVMDQQVLHRCLEYLLSKRDGLSIKSVCLLILIIKSKMKAFKLPFKEYLAEANEKPLAKILRKQVRRIIEFIENGWKENLQQQSKTLLKSSINDSKNNSNNSITVNIIKQIQPCDKHQTLAMDKITENDQSFHMVSLYPGDLENFSPQQTERFSIREQEQLLNYFKTLLDNLNIYTYFDIRDEIFAAIEPRITSKFYLKKIFQHIEFKAKADRENTKVFVQLLKDLLNVSVISPSGFAFNIQQLFTEKKSAYINMKIPNENEAELYEDALATSCLVGELYKCKLLTTDEIVACLNSFCLNKSHCSTSCLLLLLKSVGKHLSCLNIPLDGYINYITLNLNRMYDPELHEVIYSEVAGLTQLNNTVTYQKPFLQALEY